MMKKNLIILAIYAKGKGKSFELNEHVSYTCCGNSKLKQRGVTWRGSPIGQVHVTC